MEILSRGTAPDKVLCDEAFNIAKSPKYDRYQRRLVSVVYKSSNKKTLKFSAKPVSFGLTRRVTQTNYWKM